MTRIIDALEVGHTTLKKPFRLIVAGSSGSGKTEFVKKLILKSHFESNFTNILYCYPDYLDEPPIEINQELECFPGIPSLEYLGTLPKNTLIILDDMMMECSSNVIITKLFTVIARKRNISLILIVQNLYQQRSFRNIRLNTSAFALFKFHAGFDVNLRLIRDIGLTSKISRQQLDDLYRKRFSYLFIDLHPQNQFDYGVLKTNIFDQFPTYFYGVTYKGIPYNLFSDNYKIKSIKNGRITAHKIEQKKIVTESSESD